MGKLNQKTKILHAPADVGGQSWGVSSEERKLGYLSEVMVFSSSKFNFGYDYNLDLVGHNRVWKYWSRLRFFWYAIRNYDVFHIYFGEGLLPFLIDLPILKLSGKKIYFTFQGCDIRLPRFRTDQGDVINHGDICPVCESKSTLLKKVRLGIFTLVANKTYVLNPDLLFISKNSEFLPYAQIDLNEWRYDKKYSSGDELIVAHAPSNRLIKGTQFVIDAVRRLKKEGFQIELDLIENVPFSDVKARLEKADLVVDQLNIGWYGALAVEAMALGKPVICYINAEFYRKSKIDQPNPFIVANGSTIYQVLKDSLQKKHDLESIGKNSRVFVESVHNSEKIAKKLIKDYEAA